MKFSEQWLREWVDPPVDTQQLAEQLTTAGLEVDSVESTRGDFEGVIVARVLSARPHPDADRLQLCEVEFGGDATVEVVCGAANARAGLLAPFAPAGSRIRDNHKIRASKIRGVKSNGMLCSPVELALGDDGDGLLELPSDSVPGMDLVEALALDDQTIDVDLTPNRGDCLGLIGIAREIGVINRCSVKSTEVETVTPTIEDVFDVVLEAPVECPKYVGRVIRDIDPSASTPAWMVERLRRSGVRSISPSVDITNFVMLELGQPLHAFDLDKLEGGIRVRKAAPGERLVLLDGQELSLDEDILVIADHAHAVAMAGVMGGDDTGVDDATTSVFLEGAYFEPRHVAGDARRFGLHTDASHRFERGVDPEQQARAIERATALLLDIVGGRAGPVVETVSETHCPARQPVRLRRSRLARVLGVTVEDNVVTDILTRLQLNVSVTDEGWEVVPPGFRFDIEIEADLIEEVARIVGYDQLATQSPLASLDMEPRSESTVALRALRATLVNRGFREAVTYTFVDPELQELLLPGHSAIELANPISSDMRVMRLSLWTGLLQAMLYNVHRQQSSVRLFESGLVFKPGDPAPSQTPSIAGLVTGPVWPRQWGDGARDVDFFDLKSDLESLLGVGRRVDECRFVAKEHPSLHPGQSAAIYFDGFLVGWLGMLHPRIGRRLKYASNIFVFELDLTLTCAGNLPEFKMLSKFPAVSRDLSVIVDEGVSAQMLRDCVGQSTGDVLKNLELFDVYHGEGIDSGKKSLSFSLTFQTSSHTLNDEEVETLVANVVDALATELGASLRG